MAEPGIYPRGTIDYDAIDAVNFSTLKELSKSPKQYRHRLKVSKTQTPSMFRGSAGHIAILEPDRFMTHYVMWTGKQRRGKKWDAFKLEHAGKEIIKLNEYSLAVAMRDAVRSDPLVDRYLADGKPEVALVWEDKETGVLCKGRVDWLNTALHALPDIKGCKSVESRSFWRTGGALMYHTQSAFYADGYRAITGVEPMSKVIAVEFEPPHDVVVYNMPAEVLDEGRDSYRGLLIKLIECQKESRWPGYANGCELDAQLPAWMMTEDMTLDDLGLEMPGAAE